MATVIIPTPLRKFTNNASKLSVQASSISEMILSLTKNFPPLQKHLLDANGKVPSFINIFVDDDDIRNLQQEQTVIKEHSIVSIVPAIAGGAPSSTELNTL
jgi:molybdopterin converting factor small subunit